MQATSQIIRVRSTLLTLGLSGLLTLSAAAVHAQTPALYVAADLGQSRYNDVSVVQSSGRVVGGELDRNATTTAIALGWQVSPRIGLELGFADFGKVNLGGRGSSPCTPTPTCLPVVGNLSGDYRVKTTHLSLVAGLPITEEFTFFGRIGLAASKQDASVAIGAASGSGSANKTEGIFGIGASYAFGKTVEAVAEWKWLEVSQVNAASVGIRVRF